MSDVLGRDEELLTAWKAGGRRSQFARLLGEEPQHVRLERTHFRGKRPIQMNFAAGLRSGSVVPVFAEFCPGDAIAHAARLRSTLAKTRHGQYEGLTRSPIVADEETGLVLRLPGLDERLPGLRLLYDPEGARDAVARLTGRDPGPSTVRLVAHRLGKRAVLRISTRRGAVYARLRATKSGDGLARLARHEALWAVLGHAGGLRIPEPLGALPDLGLSLFGELPGNPPDFRGSSAGAVHRAISALQALAPDGLPVHSGADEARLLLEWMEHCCRYLPGLAETVRPRMLRLVDRLFSTEGGSRPCHRDLHEKQILIAGGVAGILDFDTLSLADPALDPGNLLAHLFLAGLDEHPLRSALERPRLGFWRRAALFRLAMIQAFTSAPDSAVERLVHEACRDDSD